MGYASDYPFSNPLAKFDIKVAIVLTFPLLLLIMYDFPRDRPNFYQTYICLSVFSW